MEALYTATATARGGRSGNVASSDGTLNHTLTMPKGLGGDGKPGTNPEQLFAAGYAACFESALAMVARQKGTSTKDASVTAHVSIGKDGEQGFKLAVQLDIHIPGFDEAEAQQLSESAHQACPYSKATRGNIDVKLNVVQESAAKI
ncbi:organic hydroperoxide resistance protein [Paenibacillus eucommiae]|uniref:Ohr subfamily peroxiredoxin n=1 Tax=Paenibacillus eucommiae TaxID=1355755 RepID=A0ABS4J3Q4_9BACL|nr:organic hydroperoxide resistance protein [Paenibacillus eucommiae]MBP1994472.1 Ohr subfamily peroxiredoxin [Paenibacillus eucommiae]